jgi:phosphatidylserine/phosphatidylglycerophosphate/cardiolipin synthase-like enzyme
MAGLLITACASTPPQFVPPPSQPKAVAPSALTCSKLDSTRCAIASPLRELADRVFDPATKQPGLQYANIVDVGADSLLLRLHLIRAATTSIEIQTFIWAHDEVGHAIMKELIHAARRGVKVRIIADQLLSVNDPELGARLAVTHANLQIKLYNPLLGNVSAKTTDKVTGFLTDFSLANRRMHNKIMVIDGRIGLTGGRNYENAYYDLDPEYNFFDRDVMIIGAAAATMRQSFNEYWLDPIAVALDQNRDVSAILFKNKVQQAVKPITAEDIPPTGLDEFVNNALDNNIIRRKFIDNHYPVVDVTFEADSPRKGFADHSPADKNSMPVVTDAVINAQQSLLIQTPYMLLSSRAKKALRQLRENNPDFEVMASTNSLASTDAFYVYALTMKNRKSYIKKLAMHIHEVKPVPADVETFVPRYRQLLAAYNEKNHAEVADGDVPLPVEVMGTRFGIHAKSIVIDKKVAVIGSHNFDPRSSVLNTEVTLTIKDTAFAAALDKSIRRYVEPQNSWVVARRQKVPLLGHFSELLASISSMLPVFDIWPFRYSSVYELREGMEPVPPGHAEFYDRYNNVGQFPQVSAPVKEVETLLVKSFGGVAEPLM